MGWAVSSSRIPWKKEEVAIGRDSLIHSKRNVGFNIGSDDAGNCNLLKGILTFLLFPWITKHQRRSSLEKKIIF